MVITQTKVARQVVVTLVVWTKVPALTKVVEWVSLTRVVVWALQTSTNTQLTTPT